MKSQRIQKLQTTLGTKEEADPDLEITTEKGHHRIDTEADLEISIEEDLGHAHMKEEGITAEIDHIALKKGGKRGDMTSKVKEKAKASSNIEKAKEKDHPLPITKKRKSNLSLLWKSQKVKEER